MITTKKQYRLTQIWFRRFRQAAKTSAVLINKLGESDPVLASALTRALEEQAQDLREELDQYKKTHKRQRKL